MSPEEAAREEERHETDAEDEASVSFTHRLCDALRAANATTLCGFLEDNFNFDSADDANDDSGDGEPGDLEVPTLALVMEKHPSLMQMMNKVKRGVRAEGCWRVFLLSRC